MGDMYPVSVWKVIPASASSKDSCLIHNIMEQRENEAHAVMRSVCQSALPSVGLTSEGRSKVLVLSCWLYRTVAILMLNALVAFACFELAGLGYFKIKIPTTESEPTQQLIGEGGAREKVSYYASQDWAERYWHEFRLSRKEQFYPFVGWRRAPFKGKTIEVDQNGVRVTPGAECSAKSFKVFTFGASEMWGTGSPNWATIPAHLQNGLEKLRQGPVCVTNFAESAYVSLQNIIMLLMQLRVGNVPDVVVFYTFFDNVYAAYQTGRVGTLENVDQIAARFEGRRDPDRFVDRLRSTYSYRFIDMLMAKLTIANPQQAKSISPKLITYESMGIDAATLSDLLVQEYFENYKIVSALSQKYGFKYFFFLPPEITLGNKPLTSEEQEMKRSAEGEAGLHKLSTAVYRAMEREASKYQNFYSMVHIFDSYDSLMFIDSGHVTPVGNQLIAERMLGVMQARSIAAVE